jgi:hypothetical protein
MSRSQPVWPLIVMKSESNVRLTVSGLESIRIGLASYLEDRLRGARGVRRRGLSSSLIEGEFSVFFHCRLSQNFSWFWFEIKNFDCNLQYQTNHLRILFIHFLTVITVKTIIPLFDQREGCFQTHILFTWPFLCVRWNTNSFRWHLIKMNFRVYPSK